MTLVPSLQQTPSKAPHGSDGTVNSQGLVNVNVSVSDALFSRFFAFFFLCQPHQVWQIQLMT